MTRLVLRGLGLKGQQTNWFCCPFKAMYTDASVP